MNRDIDPERVAEEANRFDALLEGDADAASALAESGEQAEVVADARYAARLLSILTGEEPRQHYASRSQAMLRVRFFGPRAPRVASTRGAFGWRPSLRWAAPVAVAAAAAAIVAVVALPGGSGETLTPGDASEAVRAGAQSERPAPVQPAAVPPSAVPPAAAEEAPPVEVVPRTPAPAPAEVVLSLDQELARLTAAVQRIQDNPQNVDGELLREVSASTAQVALTIDREPETVSRETVIIYRDTAEAGRSVLNEVTVAPGDEPALEAAQSVAEDGVVVASRYLGEDPAEGAPKPEQTPTPEPTATPEATPEPTPEPTATPEATPGPAGTGS